jgi:phytoene desaturase
MRVVVIGAGFAGLSAACFLAKGGAEVTVLERHSGPGGRARLWEEGGFRFDMGPSWYWMPDVFERFFAQFGRSVADLYTLKRLDPSYRVVWGSPRDSWDVPAGTPALRAWFESVEPGAGEALDRFLGETRYIYDAAMSDYLFRPSLTLGSFVDPRLVVELGRMRMLRSMAKYARSFFRDPRLVRLVEWPVLFLGASARNTSAMYSLMSYADMALGTWWPMGGMYRIIEEMEKLAVSLGVTFRYETAAHAIVTREGRAVGAQTRDGLLLADSVLAATDYHHAETELLEPSARQYSDRWWDQRTMSPSSLLFYLGIEGDLGGLPHHTLFFDQDLDRHMERVYERPAWPEAPLFYVSNPSVTDPSLAPAGHSNVFLLIPLAPGLPDDDEARERIYAQVMERLEREVGRSIRDRVRVKRSYAMRDFVTDYSAFQGNAYGMANTLAQTGPFRPKLRSTKVGGLYFAGQLTVPGPGMPPSLISGELSAALLLEDLSLIAR